MASEAKTKLCILDLPKYNSCTGEKFEAACGHYICKDHIQLWIERQRGKGVRSFKCIADGCVHIYNWYKMCAFLNLDDEAIFDGVKHYKGKIWSEVETDFIRSSRPNKSQVCPKCNMTSNAPKDTIQKKEFNMRCKCGCVFCFWCNQKWKAKSGYDNCGNKDCSQITLSDIDNWTKGTQVIIKHMVHKRVCPRPHCYVTNGFTRILHKANCKHMLCPKCKRWFCLLCLSLPTENQQMVMSSESAYATAWPCGGAYTKCKIIADRQVTTNFQCLPSCKTTYIKCESHFCYKK